MITEIQRTMDFDYSETQQMVAAAAKAFAQQHIAPYVRDWD
jgi:alkylation response protein AidB-like acyl-CoA dehydrogenase